MESAWAYEHSAPDDKLASLSSHRVLDAVKKLVMKGSISYSSLIRHCWPEFFKLFADRSERCTERTNEQSDNNITDVPFASTLLSATHSDKCSDMTMFSRTFVLLSTDYSCKMLHDMLIASNSSNSFDPIISAPLVYPYNFTSVNEFSNALYNSASKSGSDGILVAAGPFEYTKIKFFATLDVAVSCNGSNMASSDGLLAIRTVAKHATKRMIDSIDSDVATLIDTSRSSTIDNDQRLSYWYVLMSAGICIRYQTCHPVQVITTAYIASLNFG